jgi:8-oxo-dGTP diphosphatase
MKVFTPKRADTKAFLPGLYELPGGHIDFGEELVDGLKREVLEELGMHIAIGDIIDAFTYQNTVKGSHTVEVIYFARFTDPLEQITIHPDDHSRYDWFSEEEVRAHRDQMVPVAQAIHTDGTEDAEYQAMLKGFRLLAGQPVNFG